MPIVSHQYFNGYLQMISQTLGVFQGPGLEHVPEEFHAALETAHAVGSHCGVKGTGWQASTSGLTFFQRPARPPFTTCTIRVHPAHGLLPTGCWSESLGRRYDHSWC